MLERKGDLLLFFNKINQQAQGRVSLDMNNLAPQPH